MISAFAPIDVIVILILAMMVLFLGFDTLSLLARRFFPSTTTIIYFFPVFWVTLHLSYFLTSEFTVWIERGARTRDIRRHSKVTRAFLHPVASFFYALISAIATFFLLRKVAVICLGADLVHDIFTDGADLAGGIAFALSGALAANGLLTTARRFIRGSVDTTELERDLNTALNSLISKVPVLPSEDSAAYVWQPRVSPTPLAEKITAHPTKEYSATFSELYESSGVSLTIVAADVIRNEINLFSTHATPDMSVAKAVAASIALPIAFRPLRNALKIWVDGGIVSAIPAWVFRKQRNHDPDCKILAIRIEQYVYDEWLPVLLNERDRFIANCCGAFELGSRRVLCEWSAKIMFWLRHRRLMIRWPLPLVSRLRLRPRRGPHFHISTSLRTDVFRDGNDATSIRTRKIFLYTTLDILAGRFDRYLRSQHPADRCHAACALLGGSGGQGSRRLRACQLVLLDRSSGLSSAFHQLTLTQRESRRGEELVCPSPGQSVPGPAVISCRRRYADPPAAASFSGLRIHSCVSQ